MMKKKGFIIAILVLLVICSGVFVTYKFMLNDSSEDKEITLDKDVEKALKYIYVYDNSNFSITDENASDTSYSKGMFNTYKVDVNNLSLYGKYNLVLNMIYNDGYFDEFEYYKRSEDNWEDLIKVDVKDLTSEELGYSSQCDADYLVRKYPNINKELINKYAKDIFDIDGIDMYSFGYSCIQCNIVLGEYECMNISGGTGTRNYDWVYKYVDYEKKGEELYIYHKAFFGINDESTGDYLIFNSDDVIDNISYDNEGSFILGNEYFIAKVDGDSYNSDELLDRYGIRFKSVFKKNSNGEYRWVSTEPVIE